jgi:peptidoglycan/LPS O-acetylase OafA/YrhL
MKAPAERIQHLDGLRGAAILSVLLFHAYARWLDHVPFGDRHADVPLFKYGFLGVQLFFLISGFVILMTLERSLNFRSFLFRRWVRLFPAMLACSLLIFATAGFFHERPQGAIVARDLLPGLTFTEPSWWQRVLGGEQGFVEGAFWSLYVEVKFYVLFGITFFVFGRNIAIALLSGLFLASVLFAVQADLPVLSPRVSEVGLRLSQILSTPYFGWFAAGAMTYVYATERDPRWLVGGILIGLIAAIAGGGITSQGDRFGALLVLALFLAALLHAKVQTIAGGYFLVFIGFVSYPLYLIHENMMISMIIKLHAAAPWIPMIALPLLPIVVLVAIAWAMAAFVEPRCRKLIRLTTDGFERVSART